MTRGPAPTTRRGRAAGGRELRTWVSAAEYARAEDLARAASLSLADYVRAAAMAPTSDAYQRGHRDSLLDAAAHLDARADLYRDAAAATERTRGFQAGTPSSIQIHAENVRAETLFREAADVCRKLADRCPDDPREPS